MIQTNIRIIKGGTEFSIDTRIVSVHSQDLSPDLIEKACKTLLSRNGIAAVPFRLSNEYKLLAISPGPISNLKLEGENWFVQLEDTKNTYRLSFLKHEHQQLLALLMERCYISKINKIKRLWTLDSPRIFYEADPFISFEDISAYRRYHLSVIPITDMGLGVVINVSTAFFTNLTVAEYFGNGRLHTNKANSRNRFELLGQRQKGQKGTLLYNIGQNKSKCYFVQFCEGMRCNSTGQIRFKGKTYDSLYDYYKKERPNLNIIEGDSVAKVSFLGIDKPAFVAAKLLRLRVMNEVLPKQFNNIDKIPPFERSKLIEGFWDKIDKGELLRRTNLTSNFWIPNQNQILNVELPTLNFAQGQKINPPKYADINSYRDYYHKRIQLLNEVGCLYVPPTIQRVIHFALPESITEGMKNKLTQDIIREISKWTKNDFHSEITPYSNIQDIFDKLQKISNSGLVVFIFNDYDPATYFNIAFELKSWRIKRIKFKTLKNRYQGLHSTNSKNVIKERKNWDSFIEMNSLKILQLMNCIPWTIDSKLNYEAFLVIDVGVDQRYFSLSLLIIQNSNKMLPMYIDTIVCPKSYTKKETINEDLLRDQIIKIFKRIPLNRVNQISSLLILRDGHERGNEMTGIKQAINEITSNILKGYMKVDTIDFHKKSLKNIRFWNRINDYKAFNALEATAIKLDEITSILQNTGAATIPRYKIQSNDKYVKKQGTAEPVMVEATTDDIDMLKAVSDIAAIAQLNFTSPRVAQRLPFPLKRTDEELKIRASQEVKQIR